MTAEIKELVTVCEKQCKHYETIAKRLGLEKSMEQRFPLYRPMKNALEKIKI